MNTNRTVRSHYAWGTHHRFDTTKPKRMRPRPKPRSILLRDRDRDQDQLVILRP